ncbi:cytochrome P450 [Novosphingobium cyanobacteriorum]|uniref:Cytochrome P450 n=1 Tax=Novosphingobium cyanobacteriorum TaxID=3024215 RepID=A0ABT6CIM6_9SPHN|nr:cytochrome P450 [Novosphingobium cyanobacteriorum]MDF8333771.1 cytochrome P450 [Novosphingobium cyanobacteriorum]
MTQVQITRRPTTAVDLSDAGNWHAAVPRAEFARLRKEAPVAWNERHDGHRGFWAVSGYEEIGLVSRDTARFSSREGVISLDDFDHAQSDARRTLLEMDPPQHTAMRQITAQGFGPKAISRLEADVRRRTSALLDRLAGAGPFEAVSTLTKQIPIVTLCSILGVDDSRRDDLVRWSDLLIGSDDPDFVDPAYAHFTPQERRMLPFGHPASLDAFALGRELAEARRQSPQDDIVTLLVQGKVDQRPLNADEFLNYFLMLVVAGNETTRHTMSHLLVALAENPGEWARFRRDSLNPRLAVGEALRWATPVHFVRRVAVAPVEMAGVTIEAGEKVAMYFASANRAENWFEEPDTFRIDRARNPHVAFGGGGPHFCLGNFVAQLQLRVLIEEMASRVASVELAGQPSRLRSNHVNGIKSVELQFHAA